MAESDLNLSNVSMPHSIETEQCILGGILADPSAIPVVSEILKSEYFYSYQHKEIYSTILRMFSSGQPVDVITVLTDIEQRNIFSSPEECRKYFFSIIDILPSTENIASYCQIVKEKFQIRSLLIATQMIQEEIKSGNDDSQKLIDFAEQKIYDIRKGENVNGLVHIKDAVFSAYDHLGNITGVDREKYLGARTGFTALDSAISGLNKSDLIVIAARPGMGKTAFAMNIASNYAKRSKGKQVVVFNLEMSKEQLATRLLATEAKVDSYNLRSGRIQSNEWIRLATSAGSLSTMPMFIDETPAMSVPQIKAKLRRTENLGLVVIDYLQLMESSIKSDSRVLIVSEITRQLKIMAKEFNVPVILLSQLSRTTEQRTNKRPQLSDLRDSGSIEQDADIVMFLYREAYYNEQTEKKNVAQCIIAKNRHGETGTIDLYWDGRYTRFSDLNKSID
ncbi:MAG: replicative DNA helicase [Oscillospiraceae bacterium]|nr:replicative DNA helicase [Oscillospiraceae bacterium]